jgi:hypothetical protein
MEVPEDQRIGAEGEGYKIALSTLESGRIGIAAQSVGMARAALDYAVNYAKERQAFGGRILDFQAVGFRLADAKTKLEAARQLTLHAARLKTEGRPSLEAACMAKLFASEVAEAVCTAAIQTLGGYGYLADYPVERIYRDVRVCQIYEGTSDVQKLILQRMRAPGNCFELSDLEGSRTRRFPWTATVLIGRTPTLGNEDSALLHSS